jgi:hypothetical protein
MTKNAEQDVVTVTASRDRWRIGRLFKAKEPVPLNVAELSETELQRLEDDPVLSLRFGTADATADDPTGTEEDAGAAIIKAVLEDLTPEDFNKDGSPKVAAIEAAIDRDLSKADVTAALAGLTDEQRDTLKARLEAPGA